MNRRGLIVAVFTFGMLWGAANPAVEAARKQIKEGKFEDAIAGLDAELKKSPKNAEVKTALSDAHTAQGDFFMHNEQLPPMRKYPAALRAYRKAVEQNPANKKAKENIATIEGIYKSMGRPVPQ